MDVSQHAKGHWGDVALGGGVGAAGSGSRSTTGGIGLGGVGLGD